MLRVAQVERGVVEAQLVGFGTKLQGRAAKRAVVLRVFGLTEFNVDVLTAQGLCRDG